MINLAHFRVITIQMWFSRLQIHKNVNINRGLAQIFSGGKKIDRKRPLYKELDSHSGITKYFYDSDRHQVFRKNSNEIYQFDDETRRIFTWNHSKSNPNCDWNKPTADYEDEELIDAFENLLNYCTKNDISLSETQFDSFIDEFTERIQDFSMNDVIRILQNFSRYVNNKHEVRQRNFVELFQALDQVCTIKSQDLLPDQLLFIHSIWLTIPLAKQTYFVQLAARLFNRYIKTMTAPQIERAMFYMNCMTQPITDIRAFENVFEEKIDELTLEEFSAILWTFIRLETKLEKQELRDKYFNYLLRQDLNQLSDTMLTKVLVISTRIHTKTKSTQWANISKELRSNLENRSLKTCILMANVGLPVRLIDNDIIVNVFKRCLNHPDEFGELSIADLEYLSRILTMSNYGDKETIRKVGQLVLNEIITYRLDQVASRSMYTNFINIVRNLTMIDVYDLELMDNIFRPDYIKFIHKNSKQIDMQMYEIDGYNRLNLKGIYNGNTLPDHYLERLCYMIEWIPNRVERYRKHDEFAYVIEDVAHKLFTQNCCKYAHIVAHRRHADLIVCFDKKNLKAVDISDNFPEPYKGKYIEASCLTKDDPNLMLFALIAGNTKEFSSSMVSRNKCENIPIGFLAQKVQQIKLLGFYPIVIPIHICKEDDNASIERYIVDEVNKHFHSIGLEHRLMIDSNKN